MKAAIVVLVFWALIVGFLSWAIKAVKNKNDGFWQADIVPALVWLQRRIIELGLVYTALLVLRIFEKSGALEFLHFETTDSLRVALIFSTIIYWLTLWGRRTIWLIIPALVIFVLAMVLLAGSVFMSIHWQSILALLFPLAAIPLARLIKRRRTVGPHMEFT